MSDLSIDEMCALLEDGTAAVVPPDGIRQKLETARRGTGP